MWRILFLFFIASSVRCHASLDTNSFRHFNLKNGLPSNNVYSTIQDKLGYTWLATDNGLVKYNGYTFEVYNTDNGGLPSNDVFEMFEDRRGRIWIKTFSRRLGYIQNGKYRSITYNGGERNIFPRFFSEAGGLVYFSLLHDDGYKIVVVDDDVIKEMDIGYAMPGKYGQDTIYNVYLQNDFNIFLWSFGRHLLKIDLSSPEGVKDMGKYPEEYRHSDMYMVAMTKEGKTFLYYSGGHKLSFFDLKSFDSSEQDLREWGAHPTEGIVVFSPNYLKNNFIKNNGIFTNTHLYEFTDDMQLQSRKKLSSIIPSSQQLVYRLKDHQQNEWYSTNGDGLWIKPADYDFYSTRIRNPALDNSKYIGSSGKSSFWLNRVKQQLSELREGKVVRNMTFDKGIDMKSVTGTDSIAFLCTTDGIYLYNLKTGGMYSLDDRHQIYESKDDQEKIERSRRFALNVFLRIKLVGNELYGLKVIGLSKIIFSDSGIVISDKVTERFIDCFYDEENKQFVAYNGQRILIKNIAKGSYKLIGNEILTKEGIGNIKYIEKGPFGKFFILDDNKLFLFDMSTEKAKKLETPFSLSNSHFRIVGREMFIIGNFGIAYVPITSDSGIGKFRVVPNSGMLHYSKVEDFIVDGEGRLIVRNDLEWCLFSVDSLRKHAVSVVDKNGFFSLVVINPFESTVRSGDTLKMDQKESILKVDAINYNGKGIVKYNYRFIGSSKWETSTSGEVFLAGLPADKFHKMELRMRDDLWESDTYTLYIYRHPMWWQTSSWKAIFWVSGVLLFLGVVLLIILITRYYVAKKNERKRALTELELQAIHSQINPHFIFNTLSAALYYINKKRFDDAYAHVAKFSQLLRSYLKSSHDRYVILAEEVKMLRNYIELQQIRFEEKFDYKIEIDNKLPLENIKIPSLLLQPLVENAINHGLFHMKNGGLLLLKFSQGKDNTVLICTIEDNGVGREAAKIINETSRTRESYGTKLTHRLLDVFKQYENLDIELDYHDKTFPETGTVVRLTLNNIKYSA